MADNTTATPGSGITVRTEDIGGVHYPVVKITWGASAAATNVAMATGLPVQPATSTTWAVTQSGSWTVTGPLTDVQLRAAAVPVSASELPLPTGAATAANQSTAITALQLIDDAIATIGSTTVAKGQLAAGTDGTNARALKTDASGELQVDVLTLPALAAGTAAVGTVAPTAYSTAGTTSRFTSETSATLQATNAARRCLSIYVRSGSGDLHVRLGAVAASATDKTITIAAGGYYETPPGYTGEVRAIFAAAGTADVQELT